MHQEKALGFQLALASTAHDFEDQIPRALRAGLALRTSSSRSSWTKTAFFSLGTLGLFQGSNQVRDGVELFLPRVAAPDAEAAEPYL